MQTCLIALVIYSNFMCDVESLLHILLVFSYNKILLEQVAGEINCNNGILLYKLNCVLLEQNLLLRNLHPLMHSSLFCQPNAQCCLCTNSKSVSPTCFDTCVPSSDRIMPIFKNQLLIFLKLSNHICLLSNLFFKNWHYSS